jgi:hypothetical protein
VTFKTTVKQVPDLEDAWQAGLGALRAQDREGIRPEDPRRLGGSVDVDAALLSSQPNANRWDFAIAYRHTDHPEEVIYWVEMHTGSDKEINVVLKKLEWLKRWLRSDGEKLAAFDKEFIWVPSGPTSFTKGARQVKSLAIKGLRYSGRVLRISNKHRA